MRSKGEMLRHTRRLAAPLFAASALVLAGCVSSVAGQAAKSAGPTPNAAATPTPVPSCMNVRVDAKTVPQTTVNLAGLASAVVVATFDSFGPGRWDTPNGEMPPDPESLGTPVYRDANFTSAAALRGTAQPALTLRVAGGDTGCSHYEFSAAPQLLPGTRYVVWVIDAYDATRSGNQTPWAIAAWAVGPGDVVATPLEGALGLQAIVAIEKANPKGSHGQCQGGACP